MGFWVKDVDGFCEFPLIGNCAVNDDDNVKGCFINVNSVLV